MTLPLAAARRALAVDDGYYRGPGPWRAVTAGTEWLCHFINPLERVIVFDTDAGPMARAFREQLDAWTVARRATVRVLALAVAIAAAVVVVDSYPVVAYPILLALAVLVVMGLAAIAGALALGRVLPARKRARAKLEPGVVLGRGMHAPKGYGPDLYRHLAPYLESVTVVTHPATEKVEQLHRRFGSVDYDDNPETVTMIRPAGPLLEDQ